MHHAVQFPLPSFFTVELSQSTLVATESSSAMPPLRDWSSSVTMQELLVHGAAAADEAAAAAEEATAAAEAAADADPADGPGAAALVAAVFPLPVAATMMISRISRAAAPKIAVDALWRRGQDFRGPWPACAGIPCRGPG